MRGFSLRRDADSSRSVFSRAVFFFQAEDGIRDLVRSRGLGDVYKRQATRRSAGVSDVLARPMRSATSTDPDGTSPSMFDTCLLYTSDAADERSSVDLGGRRIIKKKKLVVYSR